MLLEGLVQRITDLETELAGVKARLAELDAKPSQVTASAPATPPPAPAKSTSATTSTSAGKATAK